MNYLRSSSFQHAQLLLTAGVLALFGMAASAAEPTSPVGSPAPIEQAPPSSIPADATTAPTAAQKPAPAALSGAASSAAPPAKDASAVPAEKTDIADAAHKLGYAPRMRKDQLVYCKREAKLGTRLQQMSCYTPDEMTAVVHASESNKESVSQIQRTELYQSGGN